MGGEINSHAIAPRFGRFLIWGNLSPSCSGLARSSTVLLDAPLDAPVKHVVVLVSLTDKEVPEELPQVGVVGLVVEPQSPSVVQKDGELVGEATAKEIRGCGHLLLHNPIVFLLLCSGLETLPGKRTTEEIHENIRERFEIIATSLLNTQVGVDGGVTGSTGEVLVLSVGNVKVGLRVSVLLGKAEINDIDLVSTLADSHQKVVWLDVTVDEITRVNVLDTRDLREAISIGEIRCDEWIHRVPIDQQVTRLS
jgi:hypothetical protein